MLVDCYSLNEFTLVVIVDGLLWTMSDGIDDKCNTISVATCCRLLTFVYFSIVLTTLIGFIASTCRVFVSIRNLVVSRS